MKVYVWLSTVVSMATALDNGLARTPPMGWLSWERFRCNIDCDADPNNCISEQLFKQMADIMVEEGYQDAGYNYVSIDACWPAPQRDANGSLVPDPKRFPSGMNALIHSKGLKFGMYEDFGHTTCLGFPGSEFYMQQDAQTFASWEIDLLKFDGCYSNPRDADYGYPVMEFFLNKTGRPILFSCEWSVYQRKQGMAINYTAVANGCNTWRNYNDIQDSWDSVLEILDYWGNNTGDFLSKAGPGSFSDPDMAGREGIFQVWRKELAQDGSYAIAIINSSDHGMPNLFNSTLGELGLSNSNGYNVTEVFDGTPMGQFKPQSPFNFRVNPSGILLVTCAPL
ncbi:hypothetical protein BaRGS_00038857 [Batillaria attramentaria]|uniref:Alpha-galactosidase n=1 Tax=Batillaria attramentaria TaxID=370345 RepID=A0ABD0J4P3_9CAEN